VVQKDTKIREEERKVRFKKTPWFQRSCGAVLSWNLRCKINMAIIK